MLHIAAYVTSLAIYSSKLGTLLKAAYPSGMEQEEKINKLLQRWKKKVGLRDLSWVPVTLPTTLLLRVSCQRRLWRRLWHSSPSRRASQTPGSASRR